MIEVAKRAKQASLKLAKLTTDDKNKILLDMATILEKNADEILKANEIDVKNAKGKITGAMIARLMVDEKGVSDIADSLRQLAKFKDYVGEVIDDRTLYNGLHLVQKRVPFGVVGVIYESRPNVTADVCGICLKSASAVILKGGKEAIHTNKVLVKLLSGACPVKDAFQLVDSSVVNEMLKLKDYIDIIIPRGGADLINFAREHSEIPVLETGTGLCHIYVDALHNHGCVGDADVNNAIKIVINAKTQKPSACNALNTLLVHKRIAGALLPKLATELSKHGVEIRGCKRTARFIKCKRAAAKDWATEFLDMIVAIKIVDSLDEAMEHIAKYGTKHSESILSNNAEHIKKFFDEVDAAVVYSNASTRFTDGGQFGLGTEIGISTQKMHARGPMALKAMTTTKYFITGTGQVRGGHAPCNCA